MYINLLSGQGDYSISGYLADKARNVGLSLLGTIASVGAIAWNVLTLQPKKAGNSLLCLTGHVVNIGAQIAKGIIIGLGSLAVRAAALASSKFCCMGFERGWDLSLSAASDRLTLAESARVIVEIPFHSGASMPGMEWEGGSFPTQTMILKTGDIAKGFFNQIGWKHFDTNINEIVESASCEKDVPIGDDHVEAPIASLGHRSAGLAQSFVRQDSIEPVYQKNSSSNRASLAAALDSSRATEASDMFYEKGGSTPFPTKLKPSSLVKPKH